MHQLKNKHKIYFYFVVFILSSTIINLNIKNFVKKYFVINEINIEIKTLDIKNIIELETKYLINNNIFFINQELLLSKLKSLKFLENIKIQKKYPSTISIRANKTDLIGITFIDQKKFYVGRNGNFISKKLISTKNNLPTIFGKFLINDFILLNKELKRQNFNLNKIEKYYFHKNKRWDIYLEGNILIKLPNKNYKQAIKIYNEFIKSNPIKKNTLIDLRIEKRLILNNG